MINNYYRVLLLRQKIDQLATGLECNASKNHRAQERLRVHQIQMNSQL